jgi:hypothetical protein
MMFVVADPVTTYRGSQRWLHEKGQ